MLLYPNRSLCRAQTSGSIFFRRDIVAYSVFLGGATAILQFFIDANVLQDFAPALPHHYGIHALGTVVGFAVVFRTSLSWQRYWEAVTQLHLMYSKWEDSYGQLLAFASISIARNREKGTAESMARVTRLTRTCDGALNMFSLMSAYAADRLLHGDNERMHQRLAVGKWRDQIVTRRQLRVGQDITGATKLPELNVSSRGSVRLTKDCNDWSDETYNVCVQPPDELKRVLETASDRCNVVMYWLIHDLASASCDMDIAPPIQSRMYQELSNGMLGLNQASKIADVPFPFPFAQILTLLMICFALFMPVYIVCFTQSLIVGPIMSFLLFQGIWGLNELAKELETPFGTDINHIPLEDFHQRFVDACQDMHKAHEAKIELCAEPTAGGIRRGNERRPSLATVQVPTSPAAKDSWSSSQGGQLNLTGGLVLPCTVQEADAEPGAPRVPAGRDEADREKPLPAQPTLAHCSTHSGTMSSGALDLRRPGRMDPMPRRRSTSTGSVGRGSDALRDLELLQTCHARESMKVFDEHLRELNERMERHLARIAADTRILSDSARTLCQRPEALAPKEPPEARAPKEPPGMPAILPDLDPTLSVVSNID